MRLPVKILPLVVCGMVLLWALPALALDGRVVNARTGKVMAGAEVTILGRPGAVYTDADGRFTIEPDPVPPFEVLVILPGERLTRPVLVESVPGDGPLIIQVAAIVNETITVTAGAAPDIAATLGSATALLPGQDIVSRQPANLTQALESMAGVSSVSEGQAAVPAIRGLARGRTLILIDGTRVTSDRRVGPSATYLDPFVLDSVEVSRGPGSVAYGSDAFGGVIDARTRRVATDAPLAGRVVGSLGVGIPQQRVGAEVSKGFGNGSVVLQGHYRDFDNYDSPAGEVFNSGAGDRGLLGRGEFGVGRGTVSLGWQSDFGRDIDRPRTNSSTVRFFYPVEDSHRLTASYDLRRVAGFERLVISAFGGRYRQMTDQDRFATSSKGRSLERADYSADDYQVRVSAERQRANARFTFGVDVNGRMNVRALDTVRAYSLAGAITSDVVNVSIDDARRTDGGVYATVETAPGPKVVLGAGARGDYVATRNVGGYFGDHSTSNAAASGNVSVSIGPWAGLRFTGQVASGFRDPTVSDRYYRGPTGRGYITGNPDLEPERSVQFDLGVRYTSGRLRAGLSGYQYRINHLIERYMTTTDFYFFRNRGTARIRGVEAEFQADLGARVTFDSAATVARGRALDDETAMDDIPPVTIMFGLRRPIASRGFVQSRCAFYMEDDRPGPTEVRMPGYTLVDLVGGVSISKYLDVNLTLRNMLDRTYPVTPDSRAVPAPGRSGVLTMTARF
jgi:outer membrane receptor protein involved in Fe transport